MEIELWNGAMLHQPSEEKARAKDHSHHGKNAGTVQYNTASPNLIGYKGLGDSKSDRRSDD